MDRSHDQSAVDAALRGEYELLDSVGAGVCGAWFLRGAGGAFLHAALLPGPQARSASCTGPATARAGPWLP